MREDGGGSPRERHHEARNLARAGAPRPRSRPPRPPPTRAPKRPDDTYSAARRQQLLRRRWWAVLSGIRWCQAEAAARNPRRASTLSRCAENQGPPLRGPSGPASRPRAPSAHLLSHTAALVHRSEPMVAPTKSRVVLCTLLAPSAIRACLVARPLARPFVVTRQARAHRHGRGERWARRPRAARAPRAWPRLAHRGLARLVGPPCTSRRAVAQGLSCLVSHDRVTGYPTLNARPQVGLLDPTNGSSFARR